MSARILLLPGVGDILWIAVKLRAFCEREGLGVPEVSVWNFDGRPRSLGYVQRIPFVTAGGYHTTDSTGTADGVFQEAYMRAGRSVFPGVLGFDYFLSVNGALRNGLTVDQAMPGLASDWYFPLGTTPAEVAAAERFRDRWPHGYVVAHFSDFGMFGRWTRAWDAKACARFVNLCAAAAGLPVVLTGSTWDAPFAAEVAKYAGCENLTGQTDTDEFFALFRGASGCVGWCGGNTILATTLRIPTLIAWSTYFTDARFFRHACPPESWGRWYGAAVVEQDTPDEAAAQFAHLMSRSR